MSLLKKIASHLNLKLSLSTGIAILLTAILLTGTSSLFSRQHQIETHRGDSLLKTVLLSSSIGGAVKFGKVEILDSTLTDFSEAQPDTFVSAVVFSAQGEQLTELGNNTASSEVMTLVMNSDAPFNASNFSVVPVTFGPELAVVGYVLVEWSDNPILHSLTQNAQIMFAISIVLAVVALVSVSIFNTKLVSRPINKLAASIQLVATGNLKANIALTGRRDEIGALERNLELLRQQLVEASELRTQQDERDKEMELAKSKMLQDLETGVGNIVHEARKGVFNTQVNQDFSDPTMQALANNINSLCSTISNFLDKLGATTAAMSQGNFDCEIPNQFEGQLAEVSLQINEMLGQVGQVVCEVSKSEASIRKAIEVMRLDAEELSTRSEKQSMSLQQAAAAMEELTANTQLATDHVQSSADKAKDSRQSAESGSEIIQKAILAVADIKAESDRISEIISVIESIAFQTNLLALNAAVEAARAGDAGKGFAVVASEVRSLAQRASDATQDITQLILTSQEKVTVGETLVNSSGEVLEKISNSIADVSSRLGDISNSTSEQNIGLAAMSNELVALDTMTQSSALIANRASKGAADLEIHAQTLSKLMIQLRSGADENEEYDTMQLSA